MRGRCSWAWGGGAAVMFTVCTERGCHKNIRFLLPGSPGGKADADAASQLHGVGGGRKGRCRCPGRTAHGPTPPASPPETETAVHAYKWGSERAAACIPEEQEGVRVNSVVGPAVWSPGHHRHFLVQRSPGATPTKTLQLQGPAAPSSEASQRGGACKPSAPNRDHHPGTCDKREGRATLATPPPNSWALAHPLGGSRVPPGKVLCLPPKVQPAHGEWHQNAESFVPKDTDPVLLGGGRQQALSAGGLGLSPILCPRRSSSSAGALSGQRSSSLGGQGRGCPRRPWPGRAPPGTLGGGCLTSCWMPR